MSAVGPSAPYLSSSITVMPASYAANVTVGSADILLSSIFLCGHCRQIFCNAAGNLYIQRRGDTAPVLYVVAAGTTIQGVITLIGGSTNHAGASAIQLVCEL